MIQNNNSSGSTQPNKPITLSKPKRGRTFLFFALGLIIILVIAIFGGYQSGISIRKETKSSAVLQQLGEQYQLALVDIQFGRYDNAKQRLEYIIQNDASFPGVQDTLTQVLVQMSTQATGQPASTVAPPTATTAPTPDYSGVQEAFTQAQQLIAAQDWTGALGALDQSRKLDPTYNTSQVDGMYYFALRNYGYDLIVKQGNLEGGIYQLTLAERFGQLDNSANGIREGARYYILGASFWELNWEQSLFYFNQIYGGWPNLWDGTMTVADRYRIASMRYGDELYGNENYCDAVTQYENAKNIAPLDNTASNNYPKAYVACHPATATPVLETPTTDPGVIIPTDTQSVAPTAAATAVPPTAVPPTAVPPTTDPAATP
jgi:tetratricopeptide (TPR) repeat protein